MIPVTCYKLQGFFIFIQTIWKNTNPLSELHATAQYCVRKILYPNIYTESPEK